MTTSKSKDSLFLDLTKSIRDSQAANQKFDDAVCRALEINRTDGRCFDILDHHGPMSAGSLAAASGLTSGAVTAVIDRLEEKGYAERLNDPGDRRRVLAGITDKGRDAAHRFYMPLAEKATEEFKDLTVTDLELLIDFHRRVGWIQDDAANKILESL
ncbi:MAG TPA: MarR family transcriptional regulator [Solirubrobacterales bacterium]|nr:MarR family transcriptional regulator [Solirubrobacterales bacterium]